MNIKRIAAAGVVGIAAASVALATVAAPASAATNIKVGTVGLNAIGTVPWAQASGIFAKNGINVTEIKLYPAPPPTLAALAAGAVDIAYAPSIAIINAYANAGMALKVIAPADGYPPGAVSKAKKSLVEAAKLDDTAVCVSPTSGIKSWKDLAGKTVSVPARGTQGEVSIAQAVKNDGGNPAAVNYVTLPFGAMLDTLKSGKTQAAFLVTPFTADCTAQGLKLIGYPGIQFFDNEVAVGMWVTTAKFAADNPAAVLGWQKSIAQVNRFGGTKTGWDKILQAANPAYTDIDLATARKSNPSYLPATIVAYDLKGPAAKMLDLGFLKKPVDVAGLLVKQYR